MNSVRRAWAIMVKELRQLRRDRLTFGMIVGIPALQLLLFGYAINQDVRHLRGGFVDQAGTQRSRMLIQDTQATQVLDLQQQSATLQELEGKMRRGEISIGVVIPPDFERRLDDPSRKPAQLLVDATDPSIQAAAAGLRAMPVPGRMGLREVPKVRSRETFELRAYYNPENRSEVFIIPGLIGVILTLTMVLFTAVAIVRERERGNMELLINTPVRRAELMVGKIIPYVGIGLIQVSIILGLGLMLFRVPLRGSVVDLYVASACFITATLAMGLLISTLVRSQFQAFQVTIFFFLPSLMLSGFMFPFEGMPRAAQVLAEVLPLTHFNRIIRAIMLRGASLAEMRLELWPLAAFFVVTLTGAVLRFQKRLG
jgi:ABC-2 type transport system permease protein